MKNYTINGQELQPQDVWIERASGYGHYNICLMMDDGKISTHKFADSHLWDEYEDIEDTQEGFDYIISHFENTLAGMIPSA